MDVPKTIKRALEATALNQVEFASRVGVSQGTVSKWLRGQEPGKAEWDRVEAFLRKDQRTRTLVRSAPSDDPPKGIEGRPAISTLAPYHPKLESGMPWIDVGGGAGAGGGGLPIDTWAEQSGLMYPADAVHGEIVIPPAALSLMTRADPRRLHWLDVRGDSMEPTLSGGDLVAINTADALVGQGGVFALRDPYGEILIKRLRRLNADQVEVVSDNPRQGNKTELLAEIAIFGRVVCRITRVG